MTAYIHGPEAGEAIRALEEVLAKTERRVHVEAEERPERVVAESDMEAKADRECDREERFRERDWRWVS